MGMKRLWPLCGGVLHLTGKHCRWIMGSSSLNHSCEDVYYIAFNDIAKKKDLFSVSKQRLLQITAGT